MSRVAGIRAAIKGLSRAPKIGVGGLAGAAFAGELLGAPIASAVQNDLLGGRRQEAAIESERSRLERQWADRHRSERVQRDMALSLQNLARLNPHLYASVLAGRPLPEEAIWIGGQPGRDALDEVAYGMATGRYAPPPGAAEQYAQSQ